MISFISLLLFSPLLSQSHEPRIYHGITVNDHHIVFSYAGQLWQVPHRGGEAVALTADHEDRFPVFSPGGHRLAFSRNLGSDDLYVMPAIGGPAKRLTWHPSTDIALEWSADGKTIHFSSSRYMGRKRLYQMPAEGGHPVDFPLPDVYRASISPNGRSIAYTPSGWRMETHTYRHYRGGLAGPFWLTDLETEKTEVIAANGANHNQFSWQGDVIYFLSDTSGAFNLYLYRTETGEMETLTDFTYFGIRYLGCSGRYLAFTRDGGIYLRDNQKGTTREVPVKLRVPRDERKPKAIRTLKYLTKVAVSGDGSTLALEARGEILTMDLASQKWTHLTQDSHVAQREPAISRDASHIAWFTDASGQYQLEIQQLGSQNSSQFIDVKPDPSFYRETTWSPNGKHIAFSGNRLDLFLFELKTKTVTRIDQSMYLAQEKWEPAWSVDGRYLCYSRGRPNHLRDIFIYDTKTRARSQITTNSHATSPVFDPNGKYLYYLSSNNAALAAANHIWDLQSAEAAGLLETRRIQVVHLRNSYPPPFLPRSPKANPAARITEQATNLEIQIDGIEERVLPLPLPPRRYQQLSIKNPGELYVTYQITPETPGDSNLKSKRNLSRVSLNQNFVLEPFAEDIGEFHLGDNVLVYTRNRQLFLKKGNESSQAIPMNQLETQVNPAKEWSQIFEEAWRLMRINFYDSKHHGQDLQALRRHFRSYLPQIARREDLKMLLRHMLGQVSISHMSIGGGDQPPRSRGEKTGTLGADIELHQGAWRIKKIYKRGRPDHPASILSAAPLHQPGLDVKKGDYILAIDDQVLGSGTSFYKNLFG